MPRLLQNTWHLHREMWVHIQNLRYVTLLIRMHAGYIPVNPQHHGALFFWYFASQYVAHEPRTVIWLNGGPGCSSLIGASMEIGPFGFRDKNTIVENNGSWNLCSNLLFVDQPVGSGFSYIDTDSFIHELDEMANQFLGFLGRYIEIFSELHHQEIYLAGESFAGQYTPYVAQAVLTQRSALKLRGLLIGNGWIDPLITYQSYLPFAVEHHLVKTNSVLYDDITRQAEICQQAYANHTHVLEKACNAILSKIRHNGAMNNHYARNQKGRCVNVYDVRLDDTYPDYGMNWPSDLVYITRYLHRKDVMLRIHVDSKKSRWTECSYSVTKTFRACHSRPSIELLPDLLRQIPIVLYSGDDDLICNHRATEKMLDGMTWNNRTGFDLDNGTLAPIEPWIVDNESAGLIQAARNLTYILFYNASHMVSYNQVSRSRVMLHQFMKLNALTHHDSNRTPFIVWIPIIILMIVCTGSISLFVCKWLQNSTFTPKQVYLYSIVPDLNEEFYALDDETFV